MRLRGLAKPSRYEIQPKYLRGPLLPLSHPFFALSPVLIPCKNRTRYTCVSTMSIKHQMLFSSPPESGNSSSSTYLRPRKEQQLHPTRPFLDHNYTTPYIPLIYLNCPSSLTKTPPLSPIERQHFSFSPLPFPQQRVLFLCIFGLAYSCRLLSGVG